MSNKFSFHINAKDDTKMQIPTDESTYTPRRNGQTSARILGSTPCKRVRKYETQIALINYNYSFR